MKKKTRRFKFRYILFGLFVILFSVASVFMHFGGFNTGKHINPEEFSAYAKPIENITVPQSAKIIALGEATHGNVEFQKLKLDVFKQMIEHNGGQSLCDRG